MRPWFGCAFLCAAISFSCAASSTNDLRGKSSLTLEESIDWAVRHNTEVLKAREEIRRNYGVIIETRGELLPQLRATGALLKREPQTTEFFGNTQTFNGQVRLSQVIYAGGALWGSTKIASLNRSAAVFGFEGVVAETILAVRRTFYLVLFNEQLIKVREASVRLLEEQLETTKRRFEAGTVPKFDVIRAEVELANARPPLIQARNGLRIAKIRLANQMALETDRLHPEIFPYVIVGALDYVPYEVDLVEALKTGMDNRPELRELARRVEARREGVHVAHAGYKPQLEVYGQFEARNPSIGDRKTIISPGATNVVTGSTSDLDPTIRGFSVGAQLSWDVFDGFSTHGRVVQARALYQAAKLDLEEKHRDIALGVRLAHSLLQEATETLESSKKVTEQGEESLRLAQARFNVGAGTQLDVLSAQTALTEARTIYVQALYDYNVAVAGLERAMGINTRVADLEELRR
jgi:outer membrane protein